MYKNHRPKLNYLFCSSQIIMCGILPRADNIHKQHHRGPNSGSIIQRDLWSFNYKATLVNERLKGAALGTTKKKLAYLPVDSQFFLHGKVNRDMVAMDGVSLSRKGHCHMATQILKITSPLRKEYMVGT